MAGSIEISGVSSFAKSIDLLKAKVDAASRDAVVSGAHLIEANAKARVPVKSGRLRRSITLVDTTSLGAGIWQARVAPTTVYGRRVELGFVGTDSLGRNFTASNPFNAHGHPYFTPGVHAAIPALPAVFEAAWATAMEA